MLAVVWHVGDGEKSCCRNWMLMFALGTVVVTQDVLWLTTCGLFEIRCRIGSHPMFLVLYCISSCLQTLHIKTCFFPSSCSFILTCFLIVVALRFSVPYCMSYVYVFIDYCHAIIVIYCCQLLSFLFVTQTFFYVWHNSPDLKDVGRVALL